MRHRKPKRLIALAFAGVLVSAAFDMRPALAFDSQTRHERAAINVRILQSEMMVAALSCNLRGQYNAMVGMFEGELVAHATTLKAMFRREHGSRGQRVLDDFITRLANDASMRSIKARGRFCSSARQTFTRLLSGQVSLAESGLQMVQQASSARTAR